MYSILWLVALIIFGVVEAATVGLASIWFAAGALAALILSAFLNSLLVQVVVFLAVSFVTLLLVRPLAQKYFNARRTATNADRVIGQEAVTQMEMADAEPDMVIGCFGGGSNFAGIGFPFLRKNFAEGKKIRVIAVEPEGCPKLTRGEFQYDFGDVAGFTPLLPMYTLGHDFQPSDIHAGGLRYHGAGSIVSQLLKDGLVEAQSLPQTETLAAGILFAKTEGIIPAPESTHAIAAAIREAMQAKEEGTPKTILFNLSGNGVIDLYAYEQYLAGALKDYAPGDAEIAKTVSRLEQLI